VEDADAPGETAAGVVADKVNVGVAPEATVTFTIVVEVRAAPEPPVTVIA
jgi:hypothetical protein